MKISVYSHAFLPSLGGLEKNTYLLAKTLTDLGHTVTILTNTPNNDTDNYPFTVVRNSSISAIKKNIADSKVVMVNGGLSLKIAIVSFFFRKPYVLIFQTSGFNAGGSGFKAKLKQKLYNALLKRSLCNVGVSFYATRLLEPLSKATGTLVNPVSDDFYNIKNKIGKTEKKYDLLFAGRFIDGKGIYLLIDAIEIAEKRINKKISVAFAGDGERENLLQYAENKHIAIVYLGRLGEQELAKAYLEAKLLAVPSTTHIEGNPLVIMEAISLGTPAIVSDQPAMVEAIGSAGISFPTGNKEILADVIVDILSNPSVLEKLTSETALRKKYFSHAEYVVSLKKILNSL